jgi:hypothetical protein
MPKYSGYKKRFRSTKRRGARYGRYNKRPSTYVARIPRTPSALSPRPMVRSFKAASITAPGPTGYIFKLSDLPSYEEYVNLFDEYCVTKIEYMFVPANNVSDSALTGSTLTTMWVANDFDGTGPADESAFMQRPNSKLFLLTGIQKWTCNSPRVSKSFFNGSISTGYGSSGRNTWIDINSPAVPHYGTYVLINAMAANSGVYVYVTVTMAFRGCR